MESPNPTPAAPVPPAKVAAPIGHVAIRGMIWQIGQALSAKAISFIQQLLIAKFFLNDEDFGLIAISQVVISLASLGQCLGVNEILVRRHRRFGNWVDTAFWLNLSGGILTMIVVYAIIPCWEPLFLGISHLFGGGMSDAPRIGGLLAIWGLWLPINAMAVVFQARLRANMQFRLLAILGFVQVASLAIIGLALAFIGLKAYSLVIPIPIVSLGIMIISWAVSRQRVRWRVDRRRLRFILKDSRYFLAGSLFTTLLQQGDYMLTSIFFPKGVLGAYYYAYRMSTQTAQLVGGNVLAVMLPSFSKMDRDEERRTIAYERTCATLLLVGVPLCFLQALLAEPLFHLVFQNKWDAALPLFQLLSIGLAFTLPTPTSTGLMLAQGRYKLNLFSEGIAAAGFLVFALCGALTRDIFFVALAVCIYFVFLGPVMSLLPIRHVKPVSFLTRIYGFPLVSGVAAMAAGWGLSALLPLDSLLLTIVQRSVGFTLALGIALLIVRPQPAVDLAKRLPGILGRSNS